MKGSSFSHSLIALPLPKWYDKPRVFIGVNKRYKRIIFHMKSNAKIIPEYFISRGGTYHEGCSIKRIAETAA